eukprot:6482088-Amphidinium_carterae.1
MSTGSKPRGAAISANNTVRSGEILQELLVQKIRSAVQNHPSKAVQLWQHCNDLGVNDDNYMTPEVPQLISKEKTAHLRRQQSAKALRVQQKEEAIRVAEESGAAEPCPTRFKTINDITVPVLKSICVHLEGGVWSSVNLTHHARTLARPGYMHLIEFATGCPIDTVVQPRFTCLSKFKEELKKRSRMRGSRGRELPLPPDFATRGIYHLEAIKEGVLVVAQRFTGELMEIDLSRIAPKGQPNCVKRLSQLQLLNNHSEKSALIALLDHAEGFEVGSLPWNHVVQDVDASKTPSPRKRLVQKMSPSAHGLTTKVARVAKEERLEKQDGNETQEEHAAVAAPVTPVREDGAASAHASMHYESPPPQDA